MHIRLTVLQALLQIHGCLLKPSPVLHFLIQSLEGTLIMLNRSFQLERTHSAFLVLSLEKAVAVAAHSGIDRTKGFVDRPNVGCRFASCVAKQSRGKEDRQTP